MKKSILNAINSINSSEEMNEVIELIKIKQKQLRAIKAQGVKSSLFVGAQVKLNSKRGVEFGEVTKINRTKAVVRIDGQLWNCPLGMLEVA
jgi:DNA-directed RNA polymerase subunit H (RpoH/RPB5)